MNYIGTQNFETKRCFLRRIKLSDYTMMYENWAKYDEKEEVVNMCKAWDDHKKRGIQEGMKQGRCLEVYSLVQDGILDPEVGASRVSMSLDDFADAMQKAGYKLPEMV